MNSQKSILCMFAGALLANGLAFATLPPPPPEERAAVEQKKAKEKEQLEKEKAQLERVQARLAARFGKSGAANQRAAGKTSDQNMPKTTSELPRGVGPNPQRPPSAEAHSGSAK